MRPQSRGGEIRPEPSSSEDGPGSSKLEAAKKKKIFLGETRQVSGQSSERCFRVTLILTPKSFCMYFNR